MKVSLLILIATLTYVTCRVRVMKQRKIISAVKNVDDCDCEHFDQIYGDDWLGWLPEVHENHVEDYYNESSTEPIPTIDEDIAPGDSFQGGCPSGSIPDDSVFLCLNICPWYCWDRTPRNDIASLNHLKSVYSFSSKSKSNVGYNLAENNSEKSLNNNSLGKNSSDDRLSNVTSPDSQSARWLIKTTTTTTTAAPTTKAEEHHHHPYVIVINVPQAAPATTTTTTTTAAPPKENSVYVIVLDHHTTKAPTTTTTEKSEDDDHWVCSVCKKQCHYRSNKELN